MTKDINKIDSEIKQMDKKIARIVFLQEIDTHSCGYKRKKQKPLAALVFHDEGTFELQENKEANVTAVFFDKDGNELKL